MHIGHRAFILLANTTHTLFPENCKIEAIPTSFANCIMPSPTDLGPLGPPPPTGQYSKHSDITDVLQAHARENGYAITINKTTPKIGAWICSKGGKYDSQGKSDTVHESKRRKNTGTTKTGCPFRVRATKDKETGQWTSVIVTEDHNHDAVAALSALPQHRIGAITDEER
jgi:hypothetical protein